MGSARPPYGSRRAALPHRALALSDDAKMPVRVFVADSGKRDPPRDEALHARPRNLTFLTSPRQRATPDSDDCKTERCDRVRVAWHSVVVRVSTDYRLHVGALDGHWIVHAAPKLRRYLTQFRLPPSAHRRATHRKLTTPRQRTEVREAQEVEG